MSITAEDWRCYDDAAGDGGASAGLRLEDPLLSVS